jgi:predicted MFS family arabinose efflux permease
MMLIPAGMFTMFFFLTLVIQNVMGESPMTTGFMFLPFSIAMVIAATVVSRLVQKVNPGRLSFLGGLIGAAAVFGFSRMPYDAQVGHLSVDINYWTHVFPFVVLMPVGMSLVFIPMTMSVVHGVSHRDSGIASGVLNTMQQVGGALGLATFSTIAFNATSTKAVELCRGLRLDEAACRTSPAGHVAFVHGASIGFLCCAAMMLVGGIVAATLNRIRHEDLGAAGPAAAAAH